jgi:hypothetical protein
MSAAAAAAAAVPVAGAGRLAVALTLASPTRLTAEERKRAQDAVMEVIRNSDDEEAAAAAASSNAADQQSPRAQVIRAVVASIQRHGFVSWPKLLPDLAPLISAAASDAVGCAGALHLLAELATHCRYALFFRTSQQVEALCARIALLVAGEYERGQRQPEEKLQLPLAQRIDVLTILRALAPRFQQAIQPMTESICAWSRNPQASSKEKILVCKLFRTLFAGVHRPHFELDPIVVETLLSLMNAADSDTDAALAATNALTQCVALGNRHQYVDVIRSFIARIVPRLLINMRIAERDLDIMRREDEKEAKLDKANREAAAGSPAGSAAAALAAASAAAAAAAPAADGGAVEKEEPAASNDEQGDEAEQQDSASDDGEPRDQSDDDEDGDDDDDDDSRESLHGASWTLRKASAATLDDMTFLFRGRVIAPMLLPLVMPAVCTVSGGAAGGGGGACVDWREREAAILALGATAAAWSSIGGFERLCEGAFGGIWPALLGECLAPDQDVSVRAITCWTLGRLVEGAKSDTDLRCGGDFNVQLRPLIEKLLVLMENDPASRVHDAACSALLNALEELGEELELILEPTVSVAIRLFNRSISSSSGGSSSHDTVRFRSLLYDLFASLFDAVPQFKDNHAELSERLVTLLLERVQTTLSPRQPEMPACLDSLARVAVSLESNFSPYASIVWPRLLQIMSELVALPVPAERSDDALDKNDDDDDEEEEGLKNDDAIDVLSTTFACASEILSALSEVSVEVEALVDGQADELLAHLTAAVSHPALDVRHAALALLSDMAQSCYSYRRPALPALLAASIKAAEDLLAKLPPPARRGGGRGSNKQPSSSVAPAGAAVPKLSKKRMQSWVECAGNGVWCLAQLAREASAADFGAPLLQRTILACVHLFETARSARQGHGWSNLLGNASYALGTVALRGDGDDDDDDAGAGPAPVAATMVGSALSIPAWKGWVSEVHTAFDEQKGSTSCEVPARGVAKVLRATPLPVLLAASSDDDCFEEIIALAQIVFEPPNARGQREEQPDEETRQMFKDALREGKKQLGPQQWQEQLERCPERTKDFVRQQLEL